ncbi:hypothetical protein Tco_1427537 [Tanacetum coccineum]
MDTTSASNLRGIQVKDIVKEVKDYLKHTRQLEWISAGVTRIQQNRLVREMNVPLLTKVSINVGIQGNFHGFYCRYEEDSNKAAFSVVAAEKIYTHESLKFNESVTYEVISKWKAGLKEDMDTRSAVYVLNNCDNRQFPVDVYS